jgi:hypothetical protein
MTLALEGRPDVRSWDGPIPHPNTGRCPELLFELIIQLDNHS